MPLTTIVISIGNSDNKLPQAQWSQFVSACNTIIRDYAETVHFFGGAATWEPWQNVAWIFETTHHALFGLQERIGAEREKYGQEAVAMIVGKTQFI